MPKLMEDKILADWMATLDGVGTRVKSVLNHG